MNGGTGRGPGITGFRFHRAQTHRCGPNRGNEKVVNRCHALGEISFPYRFRAEKRIVRYRKITRKVEAPGVEPGYSSMILNS